jgi:hypothetical protein
MPKEINIFDAVERAAARHGIPRLQLWQRAARALIERSLPIVRVLEPVTHAEIENWLIGFRAGVDRYNDPHGGNRAQVLKHIIVREAGFETWLRGAHKLRRGPQSSTTGYRDAARKTGPKSGKLQSVIAAMKEDVRAGRQTVDALRVMSDKDLVSFGRRFECARTTCREARDRVVSEFDGIKSRQIPAKDK